MYQPQLRGVTLADLYRAIRADTGLDTGSKATLIDQIAAAAVGMGDTTPLSAVMYRLGGGIIGQLIARYFGMGLLGQATAALAGYGLGGALQRFMNPPANPHPGFRSIL